MVEAKPKRVDTRARRHALNMKTTFELRQKLQERADQTGRVLTHEVEQQLIRSFEMEDRIAFLEGAISSMRQELAAYGTDPHEIAAVQAFAGLLRAVQKRHGKSWREGDCIPWVVTEAMRHLMVSQTRLPLFEGLAPFGRTVEIEAEARVMGDVARDVFVFPQLPELAPQDNPQNWTGVARHVMRIKEKATGAVLETVILREGELGSLGNVPVSPAYLEAIEKYRHRHAELDTESAIEHVLKDERSAWDRDKAPLPAAYLVGPEEAGRLMKGQPSAIKNRPAEISDRADFDEALSDRPSDGGGDVPASQGDDPPAGTSRSPAPPRRRARAMGI